MFTELSQLPSLRWIPSRIPIRDALVAFVRDGEEAPQAPISTGEQRWYPVSDGLRMVVPYEGQPFQAPEFQVERGFWDHTTCDWCGTRIAALELCYVTAVGQYEALCIACYKTHVVEKVGVFRASLWKLKRLVGAHAAA